MRGVPVAVALRATRALRTAKRLQHETSDELPVEMVFQSVTFLIP